MSKFLPEDRSAAAMYAGNVSDLWGFQDDIKRHTRRCYYRIGAEDMLKTFENLLNASKRDDGGDYLDDLLNAHVHDWKTAVGQAEKISPEDEEEERRRVNLYRDFLRGDVVICGPKECAVDDSGIFANVGVIHYVVECSADVIRVDGKPRLVNKTFKTDGLPSDVMVRDHYPDTLEVLPRGTKIVKYRAAAVMMAREQ